MNPFRWLKEEWQYFADVHLVEWAEVAGTILGIMLLGVLGLGVEWLMELLSGPPPVEP